MGNSFTTLNFSNEVSMKLGGGIEDATVAAIGAATEEPLNSAAAAAIPNNAATQGITIPQIAPVDKPLLLFLNITVPLVDVSITVSITVLLVVSITVLIAVSITVSIGVEV